MDVTTEAGGSVSKTMPHADPGVTSMVDLSVLIPEGAPRALPGGGVAILVIPHNLSLPAETTLTTLLEMLELLTSSKVKVLIRETTKSNPNIAGDEVDLCHAESM